MPIISFTQGVVIDRKEDRGNKYEKMFLVMACVALVFGICGCSNQGDVFVANEVTSETVNTQPATEETVGEQFVEEIEAVDMETALEDDSAVAEQEVSQKEVMLGDCISVLVPESWNESADGNAIVFEDVDGRALQFDLDDDANTLEYTVIIGMLETSEAANFEISAEPRTVAGHEAAYFMGTMGDADACVAVCMCVSLIGNNLLIVSYGNTSGEFSNSEIEFFDEILDDVVVHNKDGE